MEPLEITGFIFGVAGVWLTSRGSIWCFPVGLVNVIVSLFLFYGHQLYSDSLQQAVYIFLLSYGWYQWTQGKTGNDLPVKNIKVTDLGYLLLSGGILTLALGSIFSTYTKADLPWIDAAATSLSFIAQFLIARKILENWILWIIVNIVYISVYLYKDMHLYAILFAIYLILAVYGYFSWKRTMIND
jgi:nicotinamide mononucleotide transporter